MGRASQLCKYGTKSSSECIYNFDDGRTEEKGSLDHMIGCLTTKNTGFDKFDVVEVPSLTWAIFSSKGVFPKVMQEAWGKIFSESKHGIFIEFLLAITTKSLVNR